MSTRFGPEWGQGGLLGYGLSSKTPVSAPFGRRGGVCSGESVVAHSLPEDLTNSSIPQSTWPLGCLCPPDVLAEVACSLRSALTPSFLTTSNAGFLRGGSVPLFGTSPCHSSYSREGVVGPLGVGWGYFTILGLEMSVPWEGMMFLGGGPSVICPAPTAQSKALLSLGPQNCPITPPPSRLTRPQTGSPWPSPKSRPVPAGLPPQTPCWARP